MKNREFFKGIPFAHRGLHDNKTIPENSMAAFKNAVEHGYGIEFDVYLTDEGTLIVHHDPSLKRSCGVDLHPEKIKNADLDKYRLFGTDEKIPLLKDVLSFIDGRVKLIIEIKVTKKYEKTCTAVFEALKDYKGEYCLESFDPRAVLYMQNERPDLLVGQLYDPNPIQRIYCHRMKTHEKAAFLAASVKTLKKRFYEKTQAKDPSVAIVTWTIRTPAQLALARSKADNFIFESNIKDDSYIPMPPVK